MPKDAIMVGIPTMGTVRTELENRLSEYSGSSNPSVTVKRIGNVQDHAAARNSLVLWNFDSTVYSHLLMIDSDMEPPPHFIERMLSVRKAVVSGISHVWRGKAPGLKPEPLQAIWLPKTQTDGSVTYQRAVLKNSSEPLIVSRETIEPEFAGRISAYPEEVYEHPGLVTGAFCMMIESWVFGEMRRVFGLPWFKTEYLEETQEKTISEDIYFCRNLWKMGIPVSILPKLTCRHFKTVALSDVEEYGQMMYERGLADGKQQELGIEAAIYRGH